jgi:hypothetical protein
VRPVNARFAVSIAFRTPQPSSVNDAWDIDNLVKPTLDAMGAVIVTRSGRFDPPQEDGERVDYLVATKRTVRPGEPLGATIQVYDLSAPQQARDRQQHVRHQAGPAPGPPRPKITDPADRPRPCMPPRPQAPTARADQLPGPKTPLDLDDVATYHDHGCHPMHQARPSCPAKE